MKKFALMVIAVVFAAALPLSALALETSVHGIAWSTFNTSKNVGSYAVFLSDDFNKQATPENRNYSYSRAIPRIYLKFSDDLQYVIGFDTTVQEWGKDTGTAGGVNGGGGYGFGSYSFTGSVNWHNRWNYIDFRVPSTSARLKLGVQTLQDVSNLTVLTGQFPAVRLDTPIGKGKFMGFWAKMGEGVESLADDADFYGIQLAYPVTEDITVTPQWYYARGDGSHTCPNMCIGDSNGSLPGHGGSKIGYQGKDIHWLGANLKGSFKTGAGPIAVNVNIFGATGNYDETASGGTRGNYSSFLFEGRADLDMGVIKPGVILLYTSGDSNLTDNNRKLFPSINSYYAATNLFGVGFLNYYTAVTNSPSGEFFRGTPGIPSTANGITMVQVHVALKPLKKLTLIPSITGFRSTENWQGYTPPGSTMAIPNNDQGMGVEYGLELKYSIYKNLLWHTYVGAFAPGDFYQWVDGNIDGADTAFMLKSSVAVFF